jgi:hypothetical protein
MSPGRMKLAVFLPGMFALIVAIAVLSSACLNLVTGPSSKNATTSLNASSWLDVPPRSLPVQLASLGSRADHRVIFTYYDGSAMQIWDTRSLAPSETTLKDFPAGNPALAGHVFVRWIFTDTSTDPVSYPEFTTATPVGGDMEVRAYHQALPTLSYDPNGAQGQVPASVSVLSAGEAVRLAGQGDLITPTGMVFGGWYEQEWTGSTYIQTGHYNAGDLFPLGCSTTLLAKWDTLP